MRPLASVPTPRIGILGGGQLAKLTAMAASKFGCEVVVLERQEDFPAHSVDTHAIIGDWDDPALLVQLASLVDVITLENEFVSATALGVLQSHGNTIFPSAETILLVQDKFLQKQAFTNAGLPVSRFAAVNAPDDVRAFGTPAVLKKRRNSYDGKGNASVLSADDIASAWRALDGDANALYVEEFCDFDRELAVIITRGQDAAVAAYPVVETINREHICHVVNAPADIPASVADTVVRIATSAVETINGVGSFGVEFFHLRDGRIVINEIAPRVHNTGHYTIEACETSQFENHVRAVLGWPLGSTRMIAPAACMVNLLGYAPGTGTPHGLRDALAVEGAHVYVYGKTDSARGRKMGHVTAIGATIDDARSRALRAADLMHFGGDR